MSQSILRFRAPPTTASVFLDEPSNDQSRPLYTVALERAYRDREGNFKQLADSKGWSFVLDDRFMLVRREFLQIAATLPPVAKGDDVTFGRQAFLDPALHLLEPEGSA